MFQEHSTKHLLHFVCLINSHLIPVHLVCRLSPSVRILSSLVIILLVFVITTVLVKVDMSNCRFGFFIGTLASVAVVSGASNLFSGSVFGISGHFPMRISQALISGIVLVCLLVFNLIQRHFVAYYPLLILSSCPFFNTPLKRQKKCFLIIFII